MKHVVATCAAAMSLAVAAPHAANADSKGFCKQAKSMKSLDSALDSIDPSKDPKGAAKSLGKVVKEMKKLEGQAPSKQKKDIQAMRTFMEKFSKVLVKMPSEKAASDPKNAKKMAEIITEMTALTADMEKLETTSDNLSAYVKKECKIDFG